MQKYIFVFSFLLMLSFSGLQAQQKPKYSEYGLSAGNMIFTGQFTTDNSVGVWMKEQGGRFGLFTRRSLAPWFNIGVEANYGWFSLDDANHGRAQRGITVTTQVFNANVAAELILLKYGKYHWANTFAPYFKLGAGGNFFSPNIENFGELDVQTEVYPYSYQSMNVFYGIGVKFRTSYKSSLAIEIVSHNSGARQMSGVIANTINPRNDRYGGILIHYSVLIF